MLTRFAGFSAAKVVTWGKGIDVSDTLAGIDLVIDDGRERRAAQTEAYVQTTRRVEQVRFLRVERLEKHNGVALLSLDD